MKKTISILEKFAVVAVALIIIATLFFLSITIALIGLIALPIFIFLKRNRLSRKTKQPEKSIDVEFERVN